MSSESETNGWGCLIVAMFIVLIIGAIMNSCSKIDDLEARSSKLEERIKKLEDKSKQENER